jgi:hypothetical protein
VSYRDDHDAALARADALAQELAGARAEHQRDEARIAALEAQLHAYRTARPRQTGGMPRSAPPPDRVSHGKSGPRICMVLAVMAGCLVVAAGIELAVHRHERARRAVKDGWDVSRYLAQAIELARATEPDAELQDVYADFVDSAGRAQLTLPRARLIFGFRSPRLSTDPPPPERLGMPGPRRQDRCQIVVEIKRQDTSLSTHQREPSGPTCGTSLPGAPRCSVVQIWQRAIAKGAPASALADIRLRSRATESGTASRAWELTITDRSGGPSGGVTVFRSAFDDDCGSGEPR